MCFIFCDTVHTHAHTLTHTHTHQVLSPYFGGMIGFVKDVEPLLERGQRDRIKVDESESSERLIDTLDE